MSEASNQPPPLSLNHPKLDTQVDFEWRSDRYHHKIIWAAHQLESVKGDDDSWPSSPPLQQLSIEHIDGREVALGVGSAGTSQWSVSVEPIDTGFQFDWACRTSEAPGFLGSSYREQAPIKLEPERESLLVHADTLSQIVPESVLEQAGTGAVEVSY